MENVGKKSNLFDFKDEKDFIGYKINQKNTNKKVISKFITTTIKYEEYKSLNPNNNDNGNGNCMKKNNSQNNCIIDYNNIKSQKNKNNSIGVLRSQSRILNNMPDDKFFDNNIFKNDNKNPTINKGFENFSLSKVCGSSHPHFNYSSNTNNNFTNNNNKEDCQELITKRNNNNNLIEKNKDVFEQKEAKEDLDKNIKYIKSYTLNYKFQKIYEEETNRFSYLQKSNNNNNSFIYNNNTNHSNNRNYNTFNNNWISSNNINYIKDNNNIANLKINIDENEGIKNGLGVKENTEKNIKFNNQNHNNINNNTKKLIFPVYEEEKSIDKKKDDKMEEEGKKEKNKSNLEKEKKEKRKGLETEKENSSKICKIQEISKNSELPEKEIKKMHKMNKSLSTNDIRIDNSKRNIIYYTKNCYTNKNNNITFREMKENHKSNNKSKNIITFNRPFKFLHPDKNDIKNINDNTKLKNNTNTNNYYYNNYNDIIYNYNSKNPNHCLYKPKEENKNDYLENIYFKIKKNKNNFNKPLNNNTNNNINNNNRSLKLNNHRNKTYVFKNGVDFEKMIKLQRDQKKQRERREEREQKQLKNKMLYRKIKQNFNTNGYMSNYNNFKNSNNNSMYNNLSKKEIKKRSEQFFQKYKKSENLKCVMPANNLGNIIIKNEMEIFNFY